MTLVTNITLAICCCIYCCLCWGSWSNTQKLVQKPNWTSPLFYWDYIWGFFLTALIGLLLFNGGAYFEDITTDSVKWAMLGGLVWNIANICLTAAIGTAGISVGFPIGGGIGWIGGIIFNYFSSGFDGNKPLLWIGIVCALVAMILSGMSYRRLASTQQKSPIAGIVFAIISGFGFAFFYGLVIKATAPEFGGVGTLSPYQAVFFFALSVLLSTFVLNPIMMRYSVEGRSRVKDYFINGDTYTHLTGILGGFIWMSGMVISFMAARAEVNKAVSYALSNASPLVAMIWGVFIWKEFKAAPRGTNWLIALMFCFFTTAIIIITMSNK